MSTASTIGLPIALVMSEQLIRVKLRVIDVDSVKVEVQGELKRRVRTQPHAAVVIRHVRRESLVAGAFDESAAVLPGGVDQLLNRGRGSSRVDDRFLVVLRRQVDEIGELVAR